MTSIISSFLISQKKAPSCLERPLSKISLLVIGILCISGAVASHFTGLGIVGIVGFSLGGTCSIGLFLLLVCIQKRRIPSSFPGVRTDDFPSTEIANQLSSVAVNELPPVPPPAEAPLVNTKIEEPPNNQAESLLVPPLSSPTNREVDRKGPPGPTTVELLSPYAATATFSTAEEAESWVKHMTQQTPDVTYKVIKNSQGKMVLVYREPKQGEKPPPIRDIVVSYNTYTTNELYPNSIQKLNYNEVVIQFADEATKKAWRMHIENVPPFDTLVYEPALEKEGGKRAVIVRIKSPYTGQTVDVLKRAGLQVNT